ncbi:hypothetical protein ABPG77_008180 [Micractinium sp. CCAP 211/92]
MLACLISHPAPASPASWSFKGTSKTCKRALSSRQRRQLQLEPHAPGGCLPTVCGAAAFTHSTALGRHRSNDTLGVVIVNEGRRSLESDEILMDMAACYRLAHRREHVSVASPATLESAVRDCVAGGANKVMVVPYLMSRSRSTGGFSLPLALADVQLKLPGIRCITGESISVESILAQHIENQVKVVDTQPVDVAERWWTPEPLAPPSSRAEQRSDGARSPAPVALLPERPRHSWDSSAGATPSRQPGPVPARPQPAHAGQQAAQRAEQEGRALAAVPRTQQAERHGVVASRSSPASASASASLAEAAAAAASGALQAAPATTAADACRPMAVWSDDLGPLLLGRAGGMVVVRDCRSKLEPAAAAASACPAAESAAFRAHAAQQSSCTREGGRMAASITPSEVLVPAQPGLAVVAGATTSPSSAAPGKAARPLSAAAEPRAADAATLSTLCKWAEAAARVAAARMVALFFLSIWLAGAMWAFLLLNWAHISSSLLLHSLSVPLLLGMVLLLSGGVAATLYAEEQARSRCKAIA